MVEYKEKELRKRLDEAALPFKTEPQEVKKKGKELYKIALAAIEACERVRTELAAYKAPKLFDKSEPPDADAKKEKRFYGKVERIKWFLENDPDSQAFLSFLKWNQITMEEAIALAKEKSLVQTTAQ